VLRAVFDNFAVKLVSLGLAALVWLVIAGDRTSEIGLAVPVEFQNPPPNLELTSDPVNEVEVRLRATPGIIQRLGREEVSAQIDLRGIRAGEQIVHLTPANFRVPFGVAVVKITPSIIRLHFERTLQRIVPVEPRVSGEPADGYEVGEVTSEPRDVRIAGPESRVSAIRSAFTEAVSVAGAHADVSDTRTIGLDDPLVRIRDQPVVRVRVRIREALRHRTFADLSVDARGAAVGLRPARVSVSVTGPASALDGLSAADLRPWVDVTGLAGPRRVAVAVELSSGHDRVVVDGADPPEVTARPRPPRK
jgi:YbbR-like protein